ncbi:MAG: helix-turn-helix transcriptional regulator, partial [Acidimicrobiales bacterium]
HLAVAVVQVDGPRGRDALAKLGTTGAPQGRPFAALAPAPALATLFDAVRARRELRFDYHEEPRVVLPALLRFHGGRWYLVGWDSGRAAARTFRVDRIDRSLHVGAPDSGVLPATSDPATFGASLEPYRDAEEVGSDPVLVRVDAVDGPRVITEVGSRAVVAQGADGSVLLRLGVTSFDAMRSWVLGMLDHALIEGPPAARSAMIDWLESTRRSGPGDLSGAPFGAAPPEVADTPGPREDLAAAPSLVPHGHGHGPGGGQVPSQQLRLRRLLAIVSWLADVREAPLEEVSARFDIEPEEVVAELELAACCGLPPYSPDTLLEILVSEDVVQAFLPRELARPRRLTPAEGLALAASARTILAVPGADRSGALARALAKLDTVLGGRQLLVIDIDAPAHLRDVQRLVDDGIQAEIEYRSASTDEETERVVEPIAVAAFDGHWYLDAYCHRAESVRRFRVDRIRSVRPLDRPVTAQVRTHPVPVEAFVPSPSAAQVTLRVRPEEHWIVESVP